MRQNEVQRLLRMLLSRTNQKNRPKILALLVAVVIGYVLLQPVLNQKLGWNLPELIDLQGGGSTTTTTEVSSPGEEAILEAFANRQSDLIVEGSARIAKILPDDNEGSRHQKMILKLASGHTLLLAHNIDLADRVPADEGDTLEFRGEYEYSEQGGVIHWTHHDPRGKHPAGWLRYNGITYK